MPQVRTVLSRGSEGAEVAYLQTLLSLLGYYKGDIDGIFGTSTEHGVKTFQADMGLNIDGIVGSQTWNALEEVINEMLFEKPGLKIPYTDVILPWWLVSVLGGVSIAGVIEVIKWAIRRRK